MVTIEVYSKERKAEPFLNNVTGPDGYKAARQAVRDMERRYPHRMAINKVKML